MTTIIKGLSFQFLQLLSPREAKNLQQLIPKFLPGCGGKTFDLFHAAIT
jgi:hypothetical protein